MHKLKEITIKVSCTEVLRIIISKILLKESTGDALSSTVFIPGMTLTHNSSVVGLKVLGITKRKHKTDFLYNEEPIKNINEQEFYEIQKKFLLNNF